MKISAFIDGSHLVSTLIRIPFGLNKPASTKDSLWEKAQVMGALSTHEFLFLDAIQKMKSEDKWYTFCTVPKRTVTDVRSLDSIQETTLSSLEDENLAWPKRTLELYIAETVFNTQGSLTELRLWSGKADGTAPSQRLYETKLLTSIEVEFE
jgi:hypothetical protein